MRTSKLLLILSGLVLLAVMIFGVITAPCHPRRPPQDITIRHIGSVHSDNVTTLTFEITNHTADQYIFLPKEVQVRKGNAWVKFRDFDYFFPRPQTLAPRAVLSLYRVDVTNMPVGSVVRFNIRPQKALLGINGFTRRAEGDLKRQIQGGGGPWIPLNPYDTNGTVWGLPTEVLSEEWVEPE